MQDNCPMVYNLEQDPNACQPDTGNLHNNIIIVWKRRSPIF